MNKSPSFFYRTNSVEDIEYFYTTESILYTDLSREEMGMQEKNLEEITAAFLKTDEQLKETRQYIHELRISYAFDALVLTGLAIAVFQTFSFVMFSTITTQIDAVVFMFCLLVGPAALFLFLMHCYELYGLTVHSEKSIPLTLDIMYFVYIPLALTTMGGLTWYFQRHGITWQFLSAGWDLAVVLLLGGVVVALLLAKFIVTQFVAPLLPHFFTQQERHTTMHHLFERHSTRPSGVFYFRRKPNNILWENQDCFVRYKS